MTLAKSIACYLCGPQPLCAIGMPVHLRPSRRALSLLVLDARVRPHGQERVDHLQVAKEGGGAQRRAASEGIAQIEVATKAVQRPHQRNVAIRRCLEYRTLPAAV